MQQQINLAILIQAEQKKELSLNIFFRVCVIFTIALSLVYFASLWNTIKKKSHVSQITKENSTKQVELQKIKSSVSKTETEESLKAELNKITTKRNQKLQVLSILSNKSIGNVNGFSAYMKALSQQKVSGISLESFQISEGGGRLYLSGSALQNELVPLFLQSIGKEAVFSGKMFKKFQIARDKEGKFFNFKVQTEEGAGL